MTAPTTAPPASAPDELPVRPDPQVNGAHRDGPPDPPAGPARTGWQRRLFGPSEQPRWQRPALLALLAGTALLYLWGLSASGNANSYYAAAVQAATRSWKALLFGSLDAGNAITVDKPPASLWIMGLSARIFGYSSWSMLAPQALEGVATVALLYATVRRRFGAVAGLLAGAMLALTPVAVLMFRFNTPDALLTLLLVAAAYGVVRALETASGRWLALAGVAVGFAFLTKMGQALLVLPAFALVYLVAAPTGLVRRIGHLLGAGAALVVSAGWYIALVAVWPASSRPYIGGSTNNSLLELALGYNGLGRIFGGSGNPGGGSGGPGGGGGGPGGSGGGMANNGFGGSTGITRMFNTSFGGEVSWLLPAALVALVAGLWFTRRAARTDATRAALVLWGGWALVTAVVFSYMSGITHPYYSVALAPAVAALVAIGAVQLWRGRQNFATRAALAVMVAATAVWDFELLSRASSWLPGLRWAVLIVGAAVAVGLVVRLDRLGRAAAVLALAGLLSGVASSAAYAFSTASQKHSGSIPTSGPSLAGDQGGFGGGPRGGFPGGSGGFPGAPGSSQSTGTNQSSDGTQSNGGTQSAGGSQPGQRPGAGQAPSGNRPTGGGPGGEGAGNSELIALLKSTDATWAAATTGAMSAADLELASGTSVIAMGGWNGSDPAPTLAQFQAWVAAGKISYLISGGGMGGRQGGGPGGGGSNTASQITTWVQAHYTAKTVGGTTVYDLSQPTSN